MFADLLLAVLVQSDQPFDFVEKPVAAIVDKPNPEVEALRKQVEDSSDDAKIAGSFATSIDAELKSVRAELEATKKQLVSASMQIIIARKDLSAAVDKANIMSVQSDIPSINISGFFGSAQPISRTTQIVITSSDNCKPCQKFIALMRATLEPQHWTIGEDPSSQIWIEKISDAEWKRRDLSLPHVELRVKGKAQEITSRDPNVIAAKYNAAALTEGSLAPDEPLVGAVVTHINAKQQVAQFLQMMEPFLDGGKLELKYTAKPGVVKEFLTIKQGIASIRIPPVTTIVLSMHEGDLTAVFIDPKVHVVVGPLERGIQEVDITPNKLSVRLPWMIDPEAGFK